MRQIVKQTDWKNEPMPDTQEVTSYNRKLSTDEYEALLYGLCPESMDDKWFVYAQDGWLYIHRSWTGYCLFKLQLQVTDGNHFLTNWVINRDPNQYNSQGIERDIYILDWTINQVISSNIKQ